MSIKVIPGLVMLVALTGCSSRSHDNPFDPQNPSTGGAPVGLRVIANRDTVHFSWSPVEVDDLTDYLIYRAQDDQPMTYALTLPVPADNIRFTGCMFDHRYRFAVQARTRFDGGPLSAELSIIPGPHNLIVADYYDYALRRISYDGSYIYQTAEINSPVALVGDPQHNLYIVASYWMQTVYVLNREFRITRSIELSYQPVGMAYNPTNGWLFILQNGQHRLSVFSLSGIYLEAIDLPFEVDLQTYLAYDRVHNLIWIASHKEETVTCIDFNYPNRPLYQVPGLNVTNRLCAHPLVGGCWMATDSGVVRINPTGAYTRFATNYHITDISVDPGTGDCFYTGYQRTDYRWIAGKLVWGQVIQDEVLLDNTFSRLYAIQVIPGATAAGFFAVQTGYWRLLRFDGNGQLIGELPEYSGKLNFLLE